MDEAQSGIQQPPESELTQMQAPETIAEVNTSPILPNDETIQTDAVPPLMENTGAVESLQQDIPQPAIMNEPENTQAVPTPQTDINVDSAINLLNNIGTSGMANAASTVTELAGQDDSIQSQLRIVPLDEMQNEIVTLGEEIVLIDVKLHGNDPSTDIDGNLMFYLTKDVALQIANELLCNPPDGLVNEFTEDIISTVKESANIFGGQYVSAISEFIEVPITLNAPEFKTGPSSEIAESNTEEVAGKVEFALATDMNFGDNKHGRLIILLDPKSFDTIISKMF